MNNTNTKNMVDMKSRYKLEKSAQGSLEFLLLIGGGILLAVVVMFLLVGVGNQGRETVQVQSSDVDKLSGGTVPPQIVNVTPVTASCVSNHFGEFKLTAQKIGSGGVSKVIVEDYAKKQIPVVGDAELNTPEQTFVVDFNNKNYACTDTYWATVEITKNGKTARSNSFKFSWKDSNSTLPVILAGGPVNNQTTVEGDVTYYAVLNSTAYNNFKWIAHSDSNLVITDCDGLTTCVVPTTVLEILKADSDNHEIEFQAKDANNTIISARKSFTIINSTSSSIVKKPKATPAAGTYPGAQNVVLSTNTPGATIYYTLNGTTPTTSSTIYSTAIPVVSDITIKAMAAKSGMVNSAVLTSAYVINNQVATPVATPGAGTYTSAQSVTLSSATSGASIYYTLDMSDPSTSGTLYTMPITINSSSTLRAIATRSGMIGSSELSGLYVISILFFQSDLGVNHSCALLSDNTLKCWGSNSSGQLGNGTTNNSLTPTLVSGLNDVIKVSAGVSTSCALLDNNTVKCWGSNYSGNLGNNSTTDSLIPVSVFNLSNVNNISLGDNHSCALLNDSTVKCWGDNSSGQLGNGTTNSSLIPTLVSGISTATQISLGGNHSCALLSDSTIKCWGMGYSGQLGNGTANSLTPISVSGISTATQISLGSSYSCALLNNGKVNCWGANISGQLGNGTISYSATPSPVDVSGISTATQISAGYEHSCALLSDDTVKCWGNNFSGQLGDGNVFTNSSIPVSVLNLDNISHIGTGYNHSCAILIDGTAKCWGNNFDGKLGNGTTNNSSTPVSVSN